ncbi:hypothetical protein [Burkholderia cepacia]|uniref:hypothetical protein n=1 Tax=Burkholderia cepacia TaxID=292 RepID=UPI0026E0AC40|nr:hypothetical protein [Burkholderia cepacia]MDO5943275.1 hypothetical protein [Burkholderia cepacia]
MKDKTTTAELIQSIEQMKNILAMAIEDDMNFWIASEARVLHRRVQMSEMILQYAIENKDGKIMRSAQGDILKLNLRVAELTSEAVNDKVIIDHIVGILSCAEQEQKPRSLLKRLFGAFVA